MGLQIQISLNENLYIRDPEQTELGRNIVDYGIKLIEELGFENFTFKKLANEINSTEASIYRYFENKHKLLVYLVSWYWRWLEYRIDYEIHNIPDKKEQLRIAIQVLSDSIRFDPTYSHIDETALHNIVVSEATKAYHTKSVDDENQMGLFRGYKNLCHKISDIIMSMNAKYRFAHALASTLIEASHQQIFFAEHIPSLTEVKYHNGETSGIAEFLEDLAFKAIGNPAQS